MNHRDAEITDVVLVLDCKDDASVQKVVSDVQAIGLSVANLDSENGVIEGSIDSSRVHDLKAVACVRYVRPVFTYTADYPPGDPRDKDGPEEYNDESDD